MVNTRNHSRSSVGPSNNPRPIRGNAGNPEDVHESASNVNPGGNGQVQANAPMAFDGTAVSTIRGIIMQAMTDMLHPNVPQAQGAPISLAAPGVEE